MSITDQRPNAAPVAIGCVTDVGGPYVEQAARLLLSLRWFGGTLADVRFVLCVVGELSARQRAFFKRHRADVIEVERFDERHGPSNKLRFFEQEVLDQFEYVMLLDCDTIVVQDPAPWLRCRGFAAKPADLATVKPEALTSYLDAQGIDIPDGEFRYNVDKAEGPPYFNSGVIVLATRFRRSFIEAWKKFDRDLIERAEAFDLEPFHVDQASLSAAILAEGIPISPLPIRLNFPAHLALERYEQSLYETDPVIIHYHWLTDWNGFVERLPFPRAQARAAMFNARLRAERSVEALPHPALRPAQEKVVVGSGWWSANESGEWAIGSHRTRSAEFFDLWYRQVISCLSPEKIIVTDSASPNVPDHDSYPRVEWVSLDRNYGHANDIRTGKIKTHFCGWTRSVLQSALYALCCDADWFVYVEQDCLLSGEGFLRAATRGIKGDIFLGSKTQGGVGIGGKAAAAMPQNSLIIVRREGLERFITGIMAWEKSDGEESPETKLAASCAPAAELAVGFGRSRPLDFDCSHFYAQHFSDEELDRFIDHADLPSMRTSKAIYDL